VAFGLASGVLAAGTHEAVPVESLFFLVCCCFAGSLEAGSLSELWSLSNVLSAGLFFLFDQVAIGYVFDIVKGGCD
jgi:hypothetical protein